MATRKTKKSATKKASKTTRAKKAPAPNSAAAARAAQAEANALPADLPLGDHTLDSHVLASTLVQTQLPPSTVPDPVQAAVQDRQSAIARAVQDREAAARRAREHAAQVDAQAQRQRVATLTTDAEPVLRAPRDNPTRKPMPESAGGIHPDVTSSTSHALDMPVPGTGVAEITDLAPGQDISPSPPQSSSNILPQPNKPGSLYSKL